MCDISLPNTGVFVMAGNKFSTQGESIHSLQSKRPIAAVADDDIIELDVASSTLTLHLEDKEIQNRLKAFKSPQEELIFGYLQRYAELVGSAHKGVVWAS